MFCEMAWRMEIHLFLHLLVGLIGMGNENAGTMNQDVHTTKVLSQFDNGTVNLGGFRQISDQCFYARSCDLRRGDMATNQAKDGALCGKCARDGFAHSAACSRDHGNLVGESACHQATSLSNECFTSASAAFRTTPNSMPDRSEMFNRV